MVWLQTAVAANAVESQRLQRAKDYIADEQWPRAIAELTAAAADAKETSKDEALFWLAHSYNQAGDSASALEAIRRLEADFGRSRWVKPARSLRIEIAHRLGRTDVLWWTAQPAPPAPTVGPAPPAGAVPPPPPAPAPRAPFYRRPLPVPPTPPETPRPPGAVRPAAQPAPPAPRPPVVWVPEHFMPDLDLRIQALGGLVLTEDAPEAIAMLRSIALEVDTAGPARRALYAIARSKRPEARTAVVEVANSGHEPAQIAAVREMARFRDAQISGELLKVYSKAADPVKYQVVVSLGELAAAAPLLRIVESEANPLLRDTAIVTLAKAPSGREHVRLLYEKVPVESRRWIIAGLFNARDEEGLIRIAEREQRPALRYEVLEKLRLLGTPRAKQYLERMRQK